MVSKIIFPVDNSDNAKKAVHHVIEVAKRFNSLVLLVNVYNLPTELSIVDENASLYSFIKNVEHKFKGHGEKLLLEIKEYLTDRDIPTESILVKGTPGHSIIEIAKTEKAEMIIMRSRGFGTIKSFLLGSVSDYVIHHAKCPVMLIH